MPDPPKRLVVEMNHTNSGFFVYLEFVINAIVFSEENEGWVVPPKVAFGERTLEGNLNRYFEASHGDNSFDYFFSLKKMHEADPAAVDTRMDIAFWWKLHAEVGIQCYPHGASAARKSLYDTPYTYAIHDWYGENRRLASRVLDEHIAIHPDVLDEVEARWRRLFGEDDFVVGCHLRGTDKQSHIGGRKIPPEEYFPYVDRLIATRDAKIFLATDEPEFVDVMRARYGDRLRCNDFGRDARNVFQLRGGSNYRKGREVLIDTSILARCDFLLKCSSAVSEFAIFFNPELHHRSLDLQYDCRRFLDRYLVIQERDVGLFSLVLQVVHAIHAIDLVGSDRVPIVRFGDRNIYFRPGGHRGRQNVWEYFFEPAVSELDGLTVGWLLESGLPDVAFTSDVWPAVDGREPPATERIPISAPPGVAHRRIASAIIERHITPREYLLEAASRFHAEHLEGHFVIGVDVGETDSIGTPRRGAAPQLGPFFAEIDAALRREPGARIFVATDDAECLARFQERYGDAVWGQDALRHRGGALAVARSPGFTMPRSVEQDPARNGEEVVIDYLLLCRSDLLIHSTSSVSRAVLLSGPSLDAIRIPSPKPAQGQAPTREAQRRRTLVVHQSDLSYGRAFLAELRCIFVTYVYAMAKGHDFHLDVSRHPFLFSAGFERYFIPDWPAEVDFHDYDEVLVSDGPIPSDDPRFTRVRIWDLYAWIQENVPPRIALRLRRRVFHVREDIERRFLRESSRLGLRSGYAAIHIRRGDKIVEATKTGGRFEARAYLDRLREAAAGTRQIFVCADDYRAVEELMDCVERMGLAAEVKTLVQPTAGGFDMKAMIAAGEVMSEAAIVDLLVDVLICVHADFFVGTHSSNIFKVVRDLRNLGQPCLRVD